MSARRGWQVFLSLLLAVTAVKLAIVFAGPDYDGDAYAHAMAGRRLLLDPTDVALHWVWLPLLHALYAGATALGGGITALRVFNALVTSATPLLLAWLLRDHLRRTFPKKEASPLPWLAGALLAVDPLCLWLGVTGQTEPLFQIFVGVACLALERHASTAAGAAIAAAALTRYEAWPLLPVMFVLARGPHPFGPRGQGGEGMGGPRRRPVQAHLAWLLPALAILAWCLFHYRQTGQPLQFLQYNRDFVKGFLAGVGYPWGKEPSYALMSVWYIAVVPAYQMLGPAHLLALAAVRRGARELPRSLVLLGAALLAIVTIGFLRGTHLGLPRHAMALAPLYAALAALGACLLAEKLAVRFPKVAAERMTAIVALSVLALVIVTRTAPRAVSLWRATTSAYASEAAAAESLRRVARPGEPIFCEDGKIEVLSELAPDRFNRWRFNDVTPMHVTSLAKETGSALLVGSPGRAAHLPGGHIVWSGEGLVILRYDAGP